MTATQNRNTYLEQVVAQQERLEQDLRVRRPAVSMAAAAAGAGGAPAPAPPPPGVPARGTPPEPVPDRAPAVGVRITGFGRWRTVVVPPNAFVVHTRRGRGEPLHVGLGVSFRYHPATDSFLVVPGAMQTILINAHIMYRLIRDARLHVVPGGGHLFLLEEPARIAALVTGFLTAD